MSALEVQEKPVAPEAAEALQALDARIAESRKEAARGRAGSRELRWLAFIVLGLGPACLIAPYLLEQETAQIAATYGAIIGLVCSGWGIWIGLGPRSKQHRMFVGRTYAVLFALLGLLYGWALLSGAPGLKLGNAARFVLFKGL